jgi:hypothetical protein
MATTPEKLGGISSDSVRAKTGKGWEEWLAVLDRDNAQKLPHKEIAQLLYTKYKVPDWWCQMVTVGYEQARGLREVHQTAGGYVANVSKTFDAPLRQLSRACTDETLRAKWMGRKSYSVTKATPNKSVRMAWGKDGATRVIFYLTGKGTTKSQIAVQHEKLASAQQVEKMKTYWRGALTKLARALKDESSAKNF